MELLKGRSFAGLLAGGIAGSLLFSTALGIELSPLAAFSCKALAAPAVMSAQADGLQLSVEERQRRDEIMADRLRAFEKELSAYFLREEKRRNKKTFPWRGHISGDQFLPRNVLKKNQAVWKKYLELCRGFHEMQVPISCM